MRQTNQQILNHSRHGMLAPAIAFALLVVMGSVALVLDRLWLDTAMVELTRVADSASLAAGRKLANDDLLRHQANPQHSIEHARSAAARIASENLVAGETIELDTDKNGDIRFGQLVTQKTSGRVKFVETDHNPTSVVVIAQRTRRHGNPVALLFQQLTGQIAGDVVTHSEATIDNHVVGIRPIEGTPIPGLPLAILKSGSKQSWDTQITKRAGQDQFGYDQESKEVFSGSDGIPEIVLRNQPRRGKGNQPQKSNFQLVDLCNDLRSDLLSRQIHNGWKVDDLEHLDGELNFTDGSFTLTSTDTVVGEVRTAFTDMTGQGRICILYDTFDKIGNADLGRIRCVGLVAGRVMRVESHKDGSCEIVFQPCVITTRTAILAEKTEQSVSKIDRTNPYIYKLHLTQ